MHNTMSHTVASRKALNRTLCRQEARYFLANLMHRGLFTNALRIGRRLLLEKVISKEDLSFVKSIVSLAPGRIKNLAGVSIASTHRSHIQLGSQSRAVTLKRLK